MLPRLLLLASLVVGCKDSDGDGTRNGRDCAPYDPAVHPEAAEVCDGVDNNCAGGPDEGVTTTFFGSTSKPRRAVESLAMASLRTGRPRGGG